MKNILITILTLLYSVTNLYSQEHFWNRNRPKEFSEPILILQVNNAKSFEISDHSTNQKHRFKFINDSIIVSAKTDTKYVLRNNLVLPILNEVDSLEFYSFWKNKKIKKYDSFNAHITEYYEPKDDTGEVELSFKTFVCFEKYFLDGSFFLFYSEYVFFSFCRLIRILFLLGINHSSYFILSFCVTTSCKLFN